MYSSDNILYTLQVFTHAHATAEHVIIDDGIKFRNSSFRFLRNTNSVRPLSESEITKVKKKCPNVCQPLKVALTKAAHFKFYDLQKESDVSVFLSLATFHLSQRSVLGKIVLVVTALFCRVLVLSYSSGGAVLSPMWQFKKNLSVVPL